MKNQLCESFGFEHPIVLAPMAGVVSPELVAAVSNSGGLGLAPLWRFSVDDLRKYIHDIKALTDRPFGVNLNLEHPSEAQLDACLEEGVAVISLFWGRPGNLIARAKAGNAKVIYSAGDAQAAKHAADLGADAICAQGWEAGGHVFGKVATMPLIPSIVDAIGPSIPVIAAGGIADGRGLAAALALGASAAWIGTRFLAAEEAWTHPDYLQHLFIASENDTEYCENLFDIGWPDAPHRALKNSTIELWDKAGRPSSGSRPSEHEVLAVTDTQKEIVRYQSVSPHRNLTGSIEALSMWSGQGVSMVKRSQPAAEIVREIVADARQVISKLPTV